MKGTLTDELLEHIWYYEMADKRMEWTAEIWDDMAEDFMRSHGWDKPHLAYDTNRDTGTLWVLTGYDGQREPRREVWEDTGIPEREGDRLLTSVYDYAEELAYEDWIISGDALEWEGFSPEQV